MDVDTHSLADRLLRLTSNVARAACNGLVNVETRQPLTELLKIIQQEVGFPHVGLVESTSGNWELTAVAGTESLAPERLLASSAAEESIQQVGNWVVAPLSPSRQSTCLLSFDTAQPATAETVAVLAELTIAVGPIILLANHCYTAATATDGAEPSAGIISAVNTDTGPTLIGDSAPIGALREAIRRVAKTDLPVLLLGENGSGKEVASRMIHHSSPRRGEPFLAVNCAALTQSLLESELFGHEAGAFTDARDARAGKFELAANGTIFLDEIAELNLSGQAKLLRVIEDHVVVRVGGWEPITTNARVVTATNRDIAGMVREQQFREDLFYRLNVVMLEIPPLRERAEDIVPLARHFLATYRRQAGRHKLDLTKSAERNLSEYFWPGNVRELRNMMERLAFLAESDLIDGPDIAHLLDRAPTREDVRITNATLADATHDFQIHHIEKQIRAARGNMTAAAKRLGLQRSNLYRKMRQLGMSTSGEEG
jgi:Nif-specific regulatory protein